MADRDGEDFPGDASLLVHGFPPIERPGSRVLVLGSMPGIASLRYRRYYAHPRNLFWSVAGFWLGFDAGDDYGTRVASVMTAGVALWDVLRSCKRKSSLDTHIEPASVVPNDLATFLSRHRQIRRICFNGVEAEMLYRRFGFHDLPAARDLELLRLPSTSPANIALDFETKRDAWRFIHPDVKLVE